MKKHYIVALFGTLSLLANFLVPGFAFGQEIQSEQFTIECPHAGDLTFVKSPDDVTFNPVESRIWVQSSLDSAITSDTELPASSVISIQDTRSGGSDACPVQQPGFTLQVQGEDLSDRHGHTIPSNDIAIITSPNIPGHHFDSSTLANFSAQSGAGNQWLENGSPVNTTAPYTRYENFTNITATFTSGDICNFWTGNVCTILSRTAPTNSTITIGTELAIVPVPSSQHIGTYTGIITYSLSAS
jgi:hypothetical protein